MIEEPNELDEIRDQANVVGKLTPRDFAKLHDVAPQLIYYHIRNKHLKLEYCACGRKVLDVKTANAFMETKAEARRRKA